MASISLDDGVAPLILQLLQYVLCGSKVGADAGSSSSKSASSSSPGKQKKDKKDEKPDATDGSKKRGLFFMLVCVFKILFLQNLLLLGILLRLCLYVFQSAPFNRISNSMKLVASAIRFGFFKRS